MASTSAAVRKKIGTTTRVPIAELSTYYRNARRGDIPTIIGSLKAHGQYKPIVVNVGTHTGRENEVLAGNHTLLAFRDLAESEPDGGWDTILVHWVDVDEDRATRIVLVDNRSSELGGVDHKMLFELVDGLGGDLEGTGFTDLDLDALEAAARPPSLDDLADEHGDGVTDDDVMERISLKVQPGTASTWSEHREGFDSDDEALAALL